MKGSKRAKRSLLFDRYLVIFCIILLIVCSACTVVIMNKQQDANAQAVGNTLMTDDGTYKIIDSLVAEYNGTVSYTGTYLNKNAVKVYGVFEDGGRKEVKSWEGVLGPIEEGDNAFTIEYNGFTTTLEVEGVDISEITETDNYKLYAFDKAAASRLVSDIKDGEISFNEAFTDVVLCGDSRTLAIQTCLALSSDHIVAQNGVGLEHLDIYMQSLLTKNPKTIIFNYGVNSMSESWGAREKFVEQYSTLLKDIKAALPQTRIIVAAIFPTSSDFAYTQPRMNYIDDVNVELLKMCVELDVEFIDGSYILEDNPYLFNPDGLHFDDEFYHQYWMEELIKEMGIGVVELD